MQPLPTRSGLSPQEGGLSPQEFPSRRDFMHPSPKERGRRRPVNNISVCFFKQGGMPPCFVRSNDSSLNPWRPFVRSNDSSLNSCRHFVRSNEGSLNPWRHFVRSNEGSQEDIAVTTTALAVSFKRIIYAQCGWNRHVHSSGVVRVPLRVAPSLCKITRITKLVQLAPGSRRPLADLHQQGIQSCGSSVEAIVNHFEYFEYFIYYVYFCATKQLIIDKWWKQ